MELRWTFGDRSGPAEADAFCRDPVPDCRKGRVHEVMLTERRVLDEEAVSEEPEAPARVILEHRADGQRVIAPGITQRAVLPEVTNIRHQPVLERRRVDCRTIRGAGKIGLVLDGHRQGAREASYVRQIGLKRVPLRQQSVEPVPRLDHVVDETLRIHVT